MKKKTIKKSIKRTTAKKPREHQHRWKRIDRPGSGVGAEWFEVCGCGATRYTVFDQNVWTTTIEDGQES